MLAILLICLETSFLSSFFYLHRYSVRVIFLIFVRSICENVESDSEPAKSAGAFTAHIPDSQPITDDIIEAAYLNVPEKGAKTDKVQQCVKSLAYLVQVSFSHIFRI